MNSLLIVDAMANLWCEPLQDYQHVFKPARLTRAGGTTKYVTINSERIGLPNATDILDKRLFHVYHMGRRYNDDFNFSIDKTWRSLYEIANTRNLVFNVFFDNGCCYPINECFIKRLDNNDIILAITIRSFNLGLQTYFDESLQANSTRPLTIENGNVYIRSYANARYDSLQWLSDVGIADKSIIYHTVTISSQNDYVSFMAVANGVENTYNYGHSVYFKDGFVHAKPLAYTPSLLGSTWTFYYDQSVKSISFFDLNDIPVFNSQLDIGKSKYAVVREAPYSMIDYHDDVDFYLVAFNGQTQYEGVYVPRLQANVVRQITHTAYALDKTYIDSLVVKHNLLSTGVRIMAVVREGGMKRGLTPQHVRIQDLYRLNYTQLIEAMTSNVLVPEWEFASLENSSYTQVMSSTGGFDISVVEDAYGYNTAIKTCANPYSQVFNDSGHYFTRVMNSLCLPDPITNAGVRTVFCYKDGLLKGYFTDVQLYDTTPIPATMGAVDAAESFNLHLSTVTDGNYYNQDLSHVYLRKYGFRVYVCQLVGGIPNEEWEDVTDLNFHLYEMEGDSANGYLPRITWNWSLLNQANFYPCIRVNNTMYVKEVNGFGPNYNGVMQITLESENNWLGSLQTTPQHIHPGVIDVFMDGSPLIENIDYYIKWPVITIVKRPSTDPLLTKVFVRAYSVCDPVTMRNHAPREISFVKGGILSINNRYDIRNDRSIRVVADGLLQNPDTTRFSENDTGTLIRDGKPYAVMDYVLPVETFTNQPLIPFRQRSVSLDERVMDYLTSRLPNTTVQHPVVSEWRWSVFSPFCSVVIHALLDGFLNTGVLNSPYTKPTVDGWLSTYLPLLQVDPCVVGIDPNYVVISPHQYDTYIELTLAQYRFIEFIVANYLNNKVDPTLCISIG